MTLALLASISLPLAFAGDDVEASPQQKGERYLPSENPMADVDQALKRAAANGRLGLVILGANWCHDSRALARRLYEKPLAEWVEQHYETVFVDVGFYEHGKDVIQRFGSPIYYATPTVLIVNPQSGQLVNADNRHQWGNAYNISMDDSMAYFKQMASRKEIASEVEKPEVLSRLYADIQALELQLAKRVEEAYMVVGPMLKAYKADQEPDDFQSVWKEVAGFRNAVPRDMQALQDEAKQRIAAGESDIHLEYPVYRRFSWKSE